MATERRRDTRQYWLGWEPTRAWYDCVFEEARKAESEGLKDNHWIWLRDHLISTERAWWEKHEPVEAQA